MVVVGLGLAVYGGWAFMVVDFLVMDYIGKECNPVYDI